MKRSAPNAAEEAIPPGAADASEAPEAEVAAGSLAEVILHGTPLEVKQRAQDWASLCSRDLGSAVLEALSLTLELAGLPGAITSSDLEAEPSALLVRLSDWVRAQGLDPTIYPLLPTVKQGKRSVANFEKFWAFGLQEQSGAALLDSQLVASLSRWLLTLPNATIRSVRHSATVAALAMASALGQQHQALNRSHDTLSKQLQSSKGAVNARQEAQLKRDVAASASHATQMGRARQQLLETIVPSRSRDISEVIRLYTLGEVEKLIKSDPASYLQNKWTSRVFLMVHDPSADVRLKAIGVIQSWYMPNFKRSEVQDVQDHLAGFAQRCLSHLVERVADVDARVAVAAMRCLRMAPLAERLKDEEFDTLVNLVIGSREALVREEAALFINTHVFQDPGICTKDKPKKRGDANKEDAARAGGEVEDEDEAWAGGGDSLKELYNSETSISMLIEYLENYMGDKLRVTERVVGAFWPRAPSLTHWSTMVNLCLVGENQRGPGVDPVSPKQRLALLYIMEAAVRRADSEVNSARPQEKDAAALKMNQACAYIIPELPRLLDVCRPEEQQSLILSHVSKMLIEYAVDNSQSQVLVNAKALCQALRKAIEGQRPLDTIKYCADSLLGLARCFDEAKSTFLDLAKSVHRSCAELLAPESVKERLEELRPVMSRFMMLSNRGIDMCFGNMELLNSMAELLRSRVAWMKEKKEAAAAAAEARRQSGQAVKEEEEAPRGTPTAGADGPRKKRRQGARPDGVPDVRLALQLLEALCTSVMWHARMAFWVESQGASSAEGRSSAESQVSQMLEGFGELPALRAQLPRAVTELRKICCELVEVDQSAHMQFHAYFAYMNLIQLAIGVSDKLGLELEGSGLPAAPTGWGATYEVRIPKPHIQAFWTYLNSFFDKLSDVDAEGVAFNAEGSRVEPKSLWPAPSQDTMTAVRFLTQQVMEAPGEDPEASGTIDRMDRTEELLLAVLVSRAILESELEDIFAGPLGLLLLTQCEKARPKPLREVAMNLLRRLREQSRLSEELALQFFEMQQEAVEGLFRCSGPEAALGLSSSFVKLWGFRCLPWLEKPLYVVLKEAIVSCVTPDKSRLPLLEAFVVWIKNDFVQESRCKEIADELLRRCSAAGIDGERTPHVIRILKKLRHMAPLEEGAHVDLGEADDIEITSVLPPLASADQDAQVPNDACKICDTINLPGSNFCRHCGHKLEAQPASSPVPEQSKYWRVSEDAKARALARVERLKTDEG